jgi:hypothetical protein
VNLISIDPSLISSSITVSKSKGDYVLFNYCREKSALGKVGFHKWFSLCEQYVSFRFIDIREYDQYSRGEILKMVDYEKICDGILKDINNNIDKNKPSRVYIEGFSFSSRDGKSLIDLVTFSTILRKRLYDEITKDILIVSPSTLKLEACKLTYKPIPKGPKGKKISWRNNEGISGGNFTKIEMVKSIIENDSLVDPWAKHLKSIKDEILSMRNIPKPYDDLCDSYLLMKFAETNFLN